ncbi:hypothetical protein CS006_10485 [Bifidobacterium primatium]|uniref:Uncharacterized protein n=2 Tax=Bifidobacterium TaxID=1678 RepID=A0A2M9H6A7_9BIFI|nr:MULTISPECIES: hypothetical protein [Bifidobacterium]NEG95992.1 hypothetical protein [Bifidobacterium sp. SMB2]NEH12457.1 hypothetical protein [Bifidobacterium saimiriisciurei]PJM72354.1 hypothetical protein CS006_10485 [Bifidobacterium primatium]
MNVSESIDWRNMGPEQLDGRRYLARTWNGTTVDGWLRYRRIGPVAVMTDLDLPIDAIIIGERGNSLAIAYRSINVLKERI